MSTPQITSTAAPAGVESSTGTRAEDRARLATLAAEFESLLLGSVLRDMRTAGRWSDEGSSPDMLGAETFNQTFDVELSRSLAQAGGFGLSKWLLNTFDALQRAIDAAPAGGGTAGSSAGATAGAPAAFANTAASAIATSVGERGGRTGWNGLRLDAPPPGGSGAQWGGFNQDRALSGGDDGSVKDAFFRWTYGLSFNPAGKSKEEIGAFLMDNAQSAREYGLNILDVKGEQILIETQERGLEWVDVVQAAGSSNPGETRWQWLCCADEGVPTGGGALGAALAELRAAPGGSARAQALLTSSSLTGDALLASLKAETVAARSGVAPGQNADGGTLPGTVDALRRPAGTVTSNFGWRQDPFTGATSFHRGVDLRAEEGQPIASTGAGTVVFAGQDGGYGNSVIVEHADGLRTLYAHLSALLVAVGDQVAEGQRIGLAGQTGRATAPHLHYEVRAGGQAVDPLQ